MTDHREVPATLVRLQISFINRSSGLFASSRDGKLISFGIQQRVQCLLKGTSDHFTWMILDPRFIDANYFALGLSSFFSIVGPLRLQGTTSKSKYAKDSVRYTAKIDHQATPAVSMMPLTRLSRHNLPFAALGSLNMVDHSVKIKLACGGMDVRSVGVPIRWKSAPHSLDQFETKNTET